MKFLTAALILLGSNTFSASPGDDSKSIIQLEQKWTSHQNKIYSLQDLGGLPAVVTMTFASCPGACPLMVSDIKSFDRLLSKKEKKKIKFIAFSIDPARDTPAALTEFYKKMKLNSRWHLMTSDADQVREMAAVLGFSYKDIGGGDFTHSTSLFLLSADGVLLARKERSSDWKEFLDKFRIEISK